FIAEREGVFAEPASAAAVAGVVKLAKRNYFKKGSQIVCTLTGSGLKDPEFALSFDDKMDAVEPTMKAVMGAIGL
ncbi:MAG: threonine synthase, partial [Candidatus Omnitrophica bacterium]|nr:threonine synthase [Candidatus Omnitrophota bacterium]